MVVVWWFDVVVVGGKIWGGEAWFSDIV